MTERQNNIVAAIIMLTVPMVYFYGVYQWKLHQFSAIKDEIEKGSKVYFICYSSAFYMVASVVFLMSRVWWLKLVSSSVSSICAVILYEEIRYGNRQWTHWSYWLIIIVSFNYFIYYCIIERYKKEVNNVG